MWAAAAAKPREIGGLGEPAKARELWEAMVGEGSGVNQLGARARCWMAYVGMERRMAAAAAAQGGGGSGAKADPDYIGRVHGEKLFATRAASGPLRLTFLEQPTPVAFSAVLLWS